VYGWPNHWKQEGAHAFEIEIEIEIEIGFENAFEIALLNGFRSSPPPSEYRSNFPQISLTEQSIPAQIPAVVEGFWRLRCFVVCPRCWLLGIPVSHRLNLVVWARSELPVSTLLMRFAPAEKPQGPKYPVALSLVYKHHPRPTAKSPFRGVESGLWLLPLSPPTPPPR
jgi:hypothetical protein